MALGSHLMPVSTCMIISFKKILKESVYSQGLLQKAACEQTAGHTDEAASHTFNMCAVLHTKTKYASHRLMASSNPRQR